ncbi:hypothetical protein psyc5s11_20440 [Clostridium gelidum]|uniref:Positive regulator of sigma(E), RseC/MucC n=1 Tax=Clostridium gelidum TaxID=704125 RepID=A0ABM7TAJ6_9CLOT|nr:SoxR reducing system RseC family protein [Clostridium gelidum]BCZ45977.1 hypothetical protein psyc5s11_20440 [Clostridium gelidum]
MTICKNLESDYNREVINLKIKDEQIKINKSGSKRESTNMLMAAFMIFIFPIICIFLGVFIGGYIGKSIEASIEISQILGGVVAFALSMIIIKLFDKYSKIDENTVKIYWDDL